MIVALEDAPPASEGVTDYDRRHLKTYARLLDAYAEAADWHEVANIVLGLDVAGRPEHAQQVYEAHLSRARWMTKAGYKDLLADRR